MGFPGFEQSEVNDPVLSDYGSEGDLKSLSGSSEDEEGNVFVKTSCKEPVFNPEHDFENIEIDVRQIFPNAKVFKKAMIELSIQQSRQVKLIKNDKRWVRYVCKYEIECP